ncbi:MAG: flagellar hook-basal body complex protein FliE [Oscillospiraceae bacterium]|jgi:flagellar hook-basal body complex protein FliE|nr:flagellar hook-basal body complex protein FliE [Oscillospiraceae bacterium]
MTAIKPIQPLQKIDSLSALQGVQKTNEGRTSVAIPFQTMFQDAVSSAQQADSNYQGKISDMVTGKSDNLHDIMIASKKASLSLDLVVELRNKLLDAYKEIMNTSV